MCLRKSGANQDKSSEKSMQVSKATLKAVTTRYCHTDGISGSTHHHIYLSILVSEGAKAGYKLNGTQHKLYIPTHLARKAYKLCKPLYIIYVQDSTEHGCPEGLLTSIDLSQT